MDLMAFHDTIFGFTFDLGPDCERVPEFHLMVLAITRAHRGHAFAIARRHRARDARRAYQRRTHQQRTKGDGGLFDDRAIHASVLRNSSFFVLFLCASLHRLPRSGRRLRVAAFAQR
jgi:hypothetical protein